MPTRKPTRKPTRPAPPPTARRASATSRRTAAAPEAPGPTGGEPSAADRRAAARAVRHQQLLDTAVEVVRRDGPAVSMEQIAAECGITKPIIYRHFGDRDGLVLELAGAFLQQLTAALLPLTADEGSTRDLLLGAVDAYLDLIERDTNLYRFVTSQAGAERRDLLAGLVADEVALVLARRLQAAGLDDASAAPIAYGLVGMVHFAGDWWIGRPDLSRAALLEALGVLAWDGLASLELDARAATRPADPTGPAAGRDATAEDRRAEAEQRILAGAARPTPAEPAPRPRRTRSSRPASRRSAPRPSDGPAGPAT